MHFYDDSSLFFIYQNIYIYIYLCKRDLNLLNIILSIELIKTHKKVKFKCVYLEERAKLLIMILFRHEHE